MKFFTLFYLILNPVIISCQSYFDKETRYIHDNHFIWKTNPSCIPNVTCTQMTLGLRDIPVIRGKDSLAVKSYLVTLVEKLALDDQASGKLKLQIIFFISGNLCLAKAGVSDLDLHEAQINRINDWLKVIKVAPGKYNGLEVNTQGYIYLSIKNGRLKDFMINNIGLEK